MRRLYPYHSVPLWVCDLWPTWCEIADSDVWWKCVNTVNLCSVKQPRGILGRELPECTVGVVVFDFIFTDWSSTFTSFLFSLENPTWRQSAALSLFARLDSVLTNLWVQNQFRNRGQNSDWTPTVSAHLNKRTLCNFLKVCEISGRWICPTRLLLFFFPTTSIESSRTLDDELSSHLPHADFTINLRLKLNFSSR